MEAEPALVAYFRGVWAAEAQVYVKTGDNHSFKAACVDDGLFQGESGSALAFSQVSLGRRWATSTRSTPTSRSSSSTRTTPSWRSSA
eukprot:13911979-Alexandrium_andersonii.AAC.1